MHETTPYGQSVGSVEAGQIIPIVESSHKQDLSSEGLDHFFHELVDTRDNYREHWQLLVNKLESIMATQPEDVHFGPQYHFDNKGRMVNITTLVFDYKDQRRDFCLIATDQEGNIVGDGYERNIHHKKTSRIQSDGLLCTNQKGQGGAMPLNLATWHLLQLEANSKGAEVEWTFHNSNLEGLEALQRKYRRTGDDNLLWQIRDMKKQQERWQSMYGPSGKLGVGRDEKKTLRPDEDQDLPNLMEIESITLTRVDLPNDRVKPKMVSYKRTKAATETLRHQRIAALQTLLRVKLESIIQ